MSPLRIAFSITAALFFNTTAQGAEPWTQHTVLTPPTQAGYAYDSQIGFGRTVAMSPDWLAVGAFSGSCTTPAGVVGGGSVLMYRFDKLTRTYTYTQQLCGNGPGTSMAIWNDWLLLGHPHHDDTPGDQQQNGKVSFLRLDEATQQWQLVQTAAGAADSLMGYSVAMQNGVAAAGESGYNDDRGRVQTWRLNLAGTSWTSEGWLQPSALPFRTQVGEGFGAYLALDVTGCRAPGCTRPLDTMIVQSKSGLHSIERLASSWGSRTLTAPFRGTVTSFTPVAVNGSVAVAAALYTNDALDAPCPIMPGDYYQSAVRVLARQNGTAALQSKGIVCTDEIGVSPMRVTVRGMAVSPKGAEFHFGIPDYPANRIGTVSTWELSTANPPAIPTDFVADPDYTTAYSATHPGSLYNPGLMGDLFGTSIAVGTNVLAVGAPFYNGLITVHGAGYVVIYQR